MKFPQEIVDLIFFYIHRLKQDDLIEEMQNSIYLTFVGLIFRTTKSYIRFQYRWVEIDLMEANTSTARWIHRIRLLEGTILSRSQL